MSKYSLLLLLLLIIFSTSIFGGHMGYTVDGMPQGSITSNESDPGTFGAFGWAWDSAKYMFHMSTFQVDSMPVWIASIFTIMSLMVTFLIISLIRGN